MEFVELGSSGLRASVAGLGCGGSSRLGLGQGRSMEDAAGIVRAAFERGVNFLDTAMAYGTEPAIALAGLPRAEILISTKSQIFIDGRLIGPDELLANLDASLARLGTDHVDIFHLHAVRPEHYEHALMLRETLERARRSGRIRHIGITETGPRDPEHLTLARATLDPAWSVVMVAHHMLNQNSRSTVFPQTLENRIGTLVMFAVRAIFSRPERLGEALAELARAGMIDSADPAQLDFLMEEGGASSLMDAAYRYARHTPGADVVLFGTGNVAHLDDNIRSICAPPLAERAVRRLEERYGHLVGVGLDLPDHLKTK
ncbi:MAG: aldo/keto reductase [Geminicoccaceae bacterium]